MNKILYIDNNDNLFGKISEHLIAEYYANLSDDISNCMNYIESNSYSLIVINSEVCIDWILHIVTIRKTSNIPILIIADKKCLADKITALRIGADDYIVSSEIEPIEIAMQIKAWVRRYTVYSEHSETENNKLLEFEGLSIDILQHTVYKDKTAINLTKTEFDILYLLVSHKGQTFSREKIYANIWNDDFVDDRSITSHIQRLRKKIEDDAENPKYILTVRGIGYKFNQGPAL